MRVAVSLAFVGSVVLDPDRGLKQGFDEYRGVDSTDRKAPAGRQRRADAVVDDALRWIDTVAGSSYFLWAHLYDAHLPYEPPEPYGSVHGHNPYVGEIAFADSQIGRLLGALEERHLLEGTIVIVTGDHGESLGDHGEQDHGVFIYESVLRVPLIIRTPAVSARRVGGVVRLTDVMPTVLDLLGIPAPAMDGVSLIDLLTGRQRDLGLEAYSESEYPRRLGWSALRALRDGRFKLIDAPRPELYDLERDPFEEHNLYTERRALAEAMDQRLARLAKGPSAARAHSRDDAPAELRERLAALGYVAAGATRPARDGERLPDPKDCIAIFSVRNGFDSMAAVRTSTEGCSSGLR